jgi:hypothetical protein
MGRWVVEVVVVAGCLVQVVAVQVVVMAVAQVKVVIPNPHRGGR